MKRLVSFIVILSVLSASLFVSAIDPGDIRVVIGEDLTEGEIARIYGDFRLERGSVRELKVSNEDEYALLGQTLDASVIGSAACSCVCLRLLPEGSGCMVERHNISWCTEEMYRSALQTAGIEDVAVIVSAPFEVSGTAGLVGIYKAYEDLTGTSLSPDAKSVSVEELLLTGELAEELGSFDASLVVETLKGALEYTASLSDEEMKDRIRQVAGEYSIKLNDTQVEQLLSLCRQLEKLDDLKLREKVDEVKKTVEHLREMKDKAAELQEKARGWQEKLQKAGESVRSAYERASDWLEKNSDTFQKLWDDLRSLFAKDGV